MRFFNSLLLPQIVRTPVIPVVLFCLGTQDPQSIILATAAVATAEAARLPPRFTPRPQTWDCQLNAYLYLFRTKKFPDIKLSEGHLVEKSATTRTTVPKFISLVRLNRKPKELQRKAPARPQPSVKDKPEPNMGSERWIAQGPLWKGRSTHPIIPHSKKKDFKN